jgi:hypothetical protein
VWQLHLGDTALMWDDFTLAPRMYADNRPTRIHTLTAFYKKNLYGARRLSGGTSASGTSGTSLGCGSALAKATLAAERGDGGSESL